MDRFVKTAATLLGLALTAGAIGAAVSRSVAADVVGPIGDRVIRLEAQRTEDVKRLDEIRNDVKDILREMRRP
jgi:methyl coenzyme M reductase subunit C-like uncharacterized protein (methanogenesis marker protein 7)